MDKSGHQQLHQKASACWVTSEVIWSAQKKTLAGNASCEQEWMSWRQQWGQTVTLFVTLTCDKNEHPVVALLRNAIDACFENASDEERNTAVQAYMPTLVRNWSRAVKYLIELLLQSKEFLLGKMVKLWGRAEFPTLAGKMQSYHFLLGLPESSVNLTDLGQSSEKKDFACSSEGC